MNNNKDLEHNVAVIAQELQNIRKTIYAFVVTEYPDLHKKMAGEIICMEVQLKEKIPQEFCARACDFD